MGPHCWPPGRRLDGATAFLKGDDRMAGHSKFKNIMHRKGAQDKKRSAMFSKLSREITVAAKMGLPDPDANARLRAAVLAARAQSMPKDNIQRAIDKASGSDVENYEELRYEGFGPGGVSLIVEALTDNRNRTATNVRTVSPAPSRPRSARRRASSSPGVRTLRSRSAATMPASSSS